MANGKDVMSVLSGSQAGTDGPPELQDQMAGFNAPSPTMPSTDIPAYKPYIPPAKPESQPGGFGWKIAQALQGFTKAMGDAGNVGQVPEGAGALYGIARTLQARNVRQKQEQEHQDVLTQQARENTREDWKMQAEVARSNAQMRHEQLMTYQLGSDMQDKSIASGQQMVDQWRSLPKSQSEVQAENLTSAELAAQVKNKKIDPSKVTAFPTGKKFVGDDKYGEAQYATTYTVMSIPAEYQLTPQDKDWVSVLPGKYNVGTGNNDGDRMAGYVANSLYKQSQAIQAAAYDAAQTKKTQTLNTEAAQFAGDPGNPWIAARSASPKDLNAAMTHMLATIKADPDLKAKYPNIERDIRMMYADQKDDPNGVKGWEAALKEEEKERNDKLTLDERIHYDNERIRVEEANKKLQEQAKNKYIGDPNMLEKYELSHDPADKEAYRKSFPENEMSTINSIGTGHADLGSPSYVLARNSNLMDAVNFFYPDFDSSKVNGYKEAVKSASAGKDNIRLRSAGIGLKHALQLYNAVDQMKSLVPTTDAYRDKVAVFNQLAAELASFNAQSNAPGQKELEDAKATLGGDAWFNRTEGLKKTVDLMMDGISEYKHRWKEAAPSPAYEHKFFDMSPESYASGALVQGKGKVQVKDSQGRVYTFTEVAPLAKYLEAKMAIEKGAK